MFDGLKLYALRSDEVLMYDVHTPSYFVIHPSPFDLIGRITIAEVSNDGKNHIGNPCCQHGRSVGIDGEC